jgi:uncharacterized protein (TIGR00251 family)
VRIGRDGVLLNVRLTPRAARDSIDGLKDGVIQARVRAVPADGRANKALVELVAQEIGVPKSTVSVASGQTSRLKTLLISGDAKALELRVIDWLKRCE